MNLPKPPRTGYRASTNRNFRTRSLFVETHDGTDEKEPPVWSLSPEDGDYPSAHQVFINSTDEYDAALKIVGNVEQWERLCELKWFSEYVELWRREQVMLQKSRVRAALFDVLEMEMGSKVVGAATRLLAELNGKGSVGRPKKSPPKKVVDDSEEDHSRVVSLMERRGN